MAGHVNSGGEQTLTAVIINTHGLSYEKLIDWFSAYFYLCAMKTCPNIYIKATKLMQVIKNNSQEKGKEEMACCHTNDYIKLMANIE